MKILFAASECVPFVKTGGLADVIGALPKEIIKKGIDVRVILPLYKAMNSTYRSQLEHVNYFYINLGWRRQYVGIEKLVLDGVTFYFIDNEQYFGRDYIYGQGGDEGERFAFFCKAALEVLPKVDFCPDVINCNDWQTGLIPALLKVQYNAIDFYKNIKTVFTIHNLAFQGLYPIDRTEELLSLGDVYTPDKLEFYGQCSFIKGGFVYSDKITTVSPTYAEEILSPYYGERMDGMLRARRADLSGILNGIDVTEYDPEKDALIAQNYTAESFELKKLNKTALQEEMGLNVDANVPLIGMVGRLSSQKGLDLVERVLDGIMATGAQVIVLGMGESRYMDLFGWAQWKYNGQLAASFQMNHALAHKIYAASDFFLMPSMFEPCGLAQLISLRYGTLPITRETGGLRDTVLAYNEYTGEGNGFTFFNYNAHDMLHVIEKAVAIYNEQPELIAKLATRAMGGEYGWDKSALKYIEMYENLAGKTEEAPAAEAAPAEEAAPVKKPARKKKTEEPKAEGEAPAKKTTRKKASEPAAEEAPAKKPARKKKAEEPKAEGEAPVKKTTRKKKTEEPKAE